MTKKKIAEKILNIILSLLMMLIMVSGTVTGTVAEPEQTASIDSEESIAPESGSDSADSLHVCSDNSTAPGTVEEGSDADADARERAKVDEDEIADYNATYTEAGSTVSGKNDTGFRIVGSSDDSSRSFAYTDAKTEVVPAGFTEDLRGITDLPLIMATLILGNWAIGRRPGI